VFEKKYFIAILLLALVVVLNLPVPASKRIKSASRDSVAPFQNIMSLLAGDVREAFFYLARAGKSADEKRQMNEQIAQLRLQVQSLRAAEQENEELRKYVGFARRQKMTLVTGEIVARGDSSGWWQNITINRGADDGVNTNMPVITVNGLVGRIREVSKRTAEVLLITDPTSKIGAKFARTGALGIIKGGGFSAGGKIRMEMLCAAQPLRMEWLAKEQRIFVDDEIVTSGLGGVYPEGLMVGRVVGIKQDPSGLYQTADVTPVAMVNSLRYVFVVRQSAVGTAGEQ
jgi:rod shape-determining protein MreC